MEAFYNGAATGHRAERHWELFLSLLPILIAVIIYSAIGYYTYSVAARKNKPNPVVWGLAAGIGCIIFLVPGIIILLVVLISGPHEIERDPAQTAQMADELIKLKELLDAGALPPQEFRDRKKKLLGLPASEAPQQERI